MSPLLPTSVLESCDCIQACLAFSNQVKYKEDSKKEMSASLYSLLPATIATQHAREASDLQSQVLRRDLEGVCGHRCGLEVMGHPFAPAGQVQRRSEAAGEELVPSAARDQRDTAGSTAVRAAESGDTHVHTHTLV